MKNVVLLSYKNNETFKTLKSLYMKLVYLLYIKVTIKLDTPTLGVSATESGSLFLPTLFFFFVMNY